MCTLIVVRQSVVDVPLVLATNRDEFLARPWTQPRLLRTEPPCTMPIDDSAGGTWIGVNAAGLVVAVTNRTRQAPVPGRRSRGLLARDALACADAEAAHDQVLQALQRDVYNGVNVLLADAAAARLVIYGEGEAQSTALADGVHVITSIHDLDPVVLQPLCERVAQAGRSGWEACLATCQSELRSHRPYADGYSVCKHHGAYGTASSSIIAVGADGPAHYLFAGGPPCQHDYYPVPLP